MNRDLLLVGLSLLTWGVGEGMFLIFQPLYLQQMGASPVEIGGILGAVGICMSFVQAPVGYLTDRIGPRILMQITWVVGLLTTLMMAFAPSLGVFVAGMLIYGLTSAVVVPMNTYVTRARGQWSVERALTTNSAMFNAGAVVGPFLGGAIGGWLGLQAVYRFSAGIFVVSTVLIFLIRAYSVEAQDATETKQQGIFRNRQYLGFLALALLVLFASYLPQPLTPNFLQNQRGLTLAQIGQLGSIGSLSNTILALLFGRLSARAGILIGQALLCLYALLLWRGTAFPWFGLAYASLGGYRLIRLMQVAFVRSLVRSNQIGLAFGLLETVNGVTIILAPPIAGLLYASSPSSVYAWALGIMVVMLAVSPWILPLLQRLKGAVVEEVPNEPASLDSAEINGS